MNLDEIPKKVQYVMIDSNFVQGSNNTFSVNFGLNSNTFVESMRDVIGIKVVDFFVTQVGTNDNGVTDAAKFLDIFCDEVPTVAQLLDERRGQVFARIPLERNFGGNSTQQLIVHDKQWRSFHRKTNYFNPISIKQLNFRIFENQGDGDYFLLKPNASFYMILEITTIDHKAPKPDRLARSIEKLCKRLDQLPDIILNPPIPEPEKRSVHKKIPFMYLVALIAAVIFGYFHMSKSSSAMPMAPPMQSLP